MLELSEDEKFLKEEELFFKWLKEKRVSYINLSNMYGNYLEYENNKYLTETTRYSNLLAQFLQYAKLSNKNEWIKDKTIGTLYAYNKFEAAPIYETWRERIEKNKINTDLETLDYEVYKENQ